ncbi:HsdR family type I site-specific deoxyribonuclease [Bacteroides thetaiotaomicron]|uniref:type I restriction endonuclease subunit R n=1 Tax=Bacteroides thetaiotaomicron TaxID=818 RepID=UPI0021653A62|nr:HsdR family type I site-specific deoxyribonuclease [Bacteroides thetaiotaomicron]MCS2876573.1 HsdR family type I site-specific deoxyribonuclease [Bacteroides thetaiotaomicron]
MTTFDNELKFEMALIELLYTKYGWESEVLVNPTEAELLQNWAEILFTNNRSVDRLGEHPLTEGEMQQIVEQINTLRTPLKLNGFINGKTVSIKRDNPADTLHFGKEVSLKIYDRHEIAAGQSRYQIVRQPKFPTTSHMISDRRGDLMLLINGMPLIHIELKKSGIPVSQACNQIEKYSHGGIFSQGLFSLVQIFVAMNPEETLYFANPGVEGKFNKDYYFNWADFNNEPINEWNRVAASLLSIPMAHQLIGFYTVADDTDGVLKVMRSYQYQAVSAISDKVAKTKWADKEIYGGYVWHTTGSGKTMTSFKAAQLIANSKDADKVVFLMDRIELGTQSLLEYRGFADDSDSVQATENTDVLIAKLKDSDPNKTLIVTSIQKMSNIEEDGSKNDHDIALINKKRIVFIIDEAHRSTFGDMLTTIKKTFPAAIFFGFTGTPIHDENQKKKNTTSDIFGNELHRYSIADGIRDKNVLGFDPYKVLTYKDRDLRRVVALEKAKAATEEEAIADDKKREIYYRYMNDVPMAGHKDALGNYIKGIEDFIPTSQYEIPKHQHTVTNDIIDNWNTLSHGGKFHAIFATSSIPEAVIYYKLLKAEKPDLKIAALFDQSIDNNGSGIFKEDALIEMLTDYNKVYKQDFTIPTYAKYKKDVAARLAHKRPYLGIDRTPEKQLDLLIVVDQMLTGFDSKWVNTLYMDKLLKYEGLIQAFSRTNRLFGPEKPFGTIRYYRKPHTMHRNIENAFKLYSGDKPLGLFAEKLERNLERMNTIYQDIRELFSAAEVSNFEKLPKEDAERARFAKLFKEFNDYLEAAKIQGFQWDKLVYEFKNDDGKKKIRLLLDENTYLILALRYKELFGGGSGGGTGGGDIPYDIDSYLTEINTGKIDVDYMNSRFDKYLKLLQSDESTEDAKDKALAELHKTFAMLSQEEQKYANIFLHDVQRGDVMIEEGKSLRDYITEYQENAKNDQIRKFANAIGIDESKLRAFMNLHLSEENINEFGRFDELKESIDRNKAKEYFEKLESTIVPLRKVQIKIDSTLRRFVLEGGFDVE